MMTNLFELVPPPSHFAPQRQLLKWIGNKQRFAEEIVTYFPPRFGKYFEPFIGSGAVLATLQPSRALGSDTFRPLMEIWQTLRQSPERLKAWYAERYEFAISGEKVQRYESIKASYNANPNPADLLFLCRACYGGVVRFRKADGYMSTPCGAHDPIKSEAFAKRVDDWSVRVAGATFEIRDYAAAMAEAKKGDLIYCDPPYSYSQAILYGAQGFSLERLFQLITVCKARGVFVALSIDGTKKSGEFFCNLPIPSGLFEREVFIACGRSMLKRFRMDGKDLAGENVSDRLMLTY
jgi:DNA adenine methylase